jgi:hypothetical protein
MPNFSGVWNLKEQIQAIAAGRWTGVLRASCMLGGEMTTGRSETALSSIDPAPFKLGR